MRKKWRAPPAVEIEWLDAWTSIALEGPSEVILARAKLERQITRGSLVGEKDGVLMVAGDFSPPTEEADEVTFTNITAIPVGWIQKMRFLRGGRRVPGGTTQAAAASEARVLDAPNQERVAAEEQIPIPGRTA